MYAAIALSGMTALASQVIWTRTLSLLFGATVYTFSLILAVFLFGIGIGSSVGSMLARSLERPRLALGWVQMLLCGAIAWAAYTLALSLPFWPIDPSISTSPWYNFPLDLARAFWVVLPASILWGASFPLALASVAGKGQDPGRLVGGVYAANTVGAIVGAIGGSLLMVTWLGTQHSQQALIILSGLAALLVLEPLQGSTDAGRPRSAWAGTLPIVIGAVIAALLARNVPPIPKLLVAYGRYAATRATQNIDVIYMGEGWNASVAVTRLPGGVLNYHNAGKVQASSEPQDMRLQRMLGHLTTLIPKSPKKGTRHRLRRRRHRRCGLDRSRSRARNDRRDRTARAEGRLDLLRRAQLQRRHQPESARAARRRAPLSDDDEGEVRRDHVGSARPLGQGRGDALHTGVLRDRQVAPQSRRRRHAVRAAVREQHGGSEERDRDVHGSLPERRRLG